MQMQSISHKINILFQDFKGFCIRLSISGFINSLSKRIYYSKPIGKQINWKKKKMNHFFNRFTIFYPFLSVMMIWMYKIFAFGYWQIRKKEKKKKNWGNHTINLKWSHIHILKISGVVPSLFFFLLTSIAFPLLSIVYIGEGGYYSIFPFPPPHTLTYTFFVFPWSIATLFSFEL